MCHSVYLCCNLSLPQEMIWHDRLKFIINKTDSKHFDFISHTYNKLLFIFQMKDLFFHHYAEPKGSFQLHVVSKNTINYAMTLHPVKNDSQQYKLHSYFQSEQSKQLRHKMLALSQEINDMNHIINTKSQENDGVKLTDVNHIINIALQQYDDDGLQAKHSINTTSPSQDYEKSKVKLRFPSDSDYVIPWEGIGSKFAHYSFKTANPHPQLQNSYEAALADLVSQVKLKIYHEFKGLHRDFETHAIKTKLKYAYHRVDPFNGAQYVLNVMFVYRQKRHRVKIKHMHLYLKQQFTETEFSEECCDTVTSCEINSNEVINSLLPGDNSGRVATNCDQVLHFILPISGRFQTFQSFIKKFEDSVLNHEQRIVLAVILYNDPLNSANQIQSVMDALSLRYPNHQFYTLHMEGDFSRGRALQTGAQLFSNDSLLVFTDVDFHVDRTTIHRLRKNAIRGKQVYFPIFFSEFEQETSCGIACQDSEREFHHQKGYWRQSSYGPVSVYNSDFQAVGGFNLSIIGWGKEDLLLCESFLKARYTVMRTVDVGMVHKYHVIRCDASLEQSQYNMCLGTKSNTYASSDRLADLLSSYGVL